MAPGVSCGPALAIACCSSSITHSCTIFFLPCLSIMYFLSMDRPFAIPLSFVFLLDMIFCSKICGATSVSCFLLLLPSLRFVISLSSRISLLHPDWITALFPVVPLPTYLFFCFLESAKFVVLLIVSVSLAFSVVFISIRFLPRFKVFFRVSCLSITCLSVPTLRFNLFVFFVS